MYVGDYDERADGEAKVVAPPQEVKPAAIPKPAPVESRPTSQPAFEERSKIPPKQLEPEDNSTLMYVGAAVAIAGIAFMAYKKMQA